MKQPILRKTQAERKIATRSAVLAAAISVLHEYGYGATTTVMVVEKAGISRGAMLNYFRTKADLMTFVVEAVYKEEVEEYSRLLKDVDTLNGRMLAYIDAAWLLLSRPSGVAVLEILMGSRSDPVLAEKLKPIQDRIEADSFRRVGKELGHPVSQGLARLVVWAIRGLTIENVLMGGDGAAASVQILRRMIQKMHDDELLPVPPLPA